VNLLQQPKAEPFSELFDFLNQIFYLADPYQSNKVNSTSCQQS
jgi:hypothetical protein